MVNGATKSPLRCSAERFSFPALGKGRSDMKRRLPRTFARVVGWVAQRGCLMLVLMWATAGQALPLSGLVTPEAPSLVLPPISVPGADYVLSFDIAFQQTLAPSESTALNPLLLMDSFRISVTDVSGADHFDIVTLDAIEGYDAATGFGITLSETSSALGDVGEVPGAAGASVQFDASAVTVTASFLGPGVIQITLDYFNELDGFGGTGTLDNVVLVPEPGSAVLLGLGLLLLLPFRRSLQLGRIRSQ